MRRNLGHAGRLLAIVGCRSGVQRPPNAGEMVIAMPDGVILEHELARDWGIA